jgi:hypothetical protein
VFGGRGWRCDQLTWSADRVAAGALISVGRRSWLTLRSAPAPMVDGSGWRCHQLVWSALAWSAAVVGIAISTRGRRSWLALPSLLVVSARVFGGRGRWSWSWLPSALVVDGRRRRSDQRPWSSVAVGAAISNHGRRSWLALRSALMVVVGATISGVRSAVVVGAVISVHGMAHGRQ